MTVTEPHGRASVEPAKGLRRELRLLETAALSVGISAPTAVLALNGVLPASLVGKSVALAFLFAAIGIGLVSYIFVQLARRFASAGSVYSIAGRAWGPRAGFFGGWALMGAYIAFTVGSFAEVGLFGGAFLDGIGVSHVNWIVLGLVGAAGVWVLLYRDIRVATRALLTSEGLSLLGIIALFAVIYVKLFGHSAPSGQHFTVSPFSAHGLTFSTIALASVGGFLSFVGFEGAATLGEESLEPRKTIPRALIINVVTLGILFTLGMFTETLGFGVGSAGVHAFANSSSPLQDLSKSYVGSWLGDLIMLGATFSAFASALGTSAAGSRILFALGRDGFLSPKLGQSHSKTGAPANAASTIMLIAVATVVVLRLDGTSAVNAFFYLGTIGVLLILVAYVVTNIAGIKFLFLGRQVVLYQVLVPLLAIAVLGYTVYKQVYPVPAHPYNLFPYIAGGWCLVGGALIVFIPGLAARVGKRLAEETTE